MDNNVMREESEKLKQTLSRIDEIIAQNETIREKIINDALDGNTQWASYRGHMGEEEDAVLHRAKASPYFGRIDILDNDKGIADSKSFCIGKYHIPVEYVYSLGTSVGHLFYDPYNTANRALPHYLRNL